MFRSCLCANLRFAVVVFALLFTTLSHAALMDCAQLVAPDTGPDVICAADELTLAGPSVGLVPAEAMPPHALTKSGFELGAQANNSLQGAIPLMVLLIALVGVLLTRAKSFNSK